MITVTLVVFILQFRSQEKSIRESSYQGLMGRYNDFIGALVDKPELMKPLMENISAEGDKLSREDAVHLAHLLAAYGIVEEAFSLYSKGWIDEENWSQWAAWLKVLARHPLFSQMFKGTSGTFDKRFENFVSKEILGEEK